MRDETHEAGRRAARNTSARAAAELVGKLAAFVLFAVLARKTGSHGLGAFVAAFAFLQIALIPVDLGYDRWLIKQVSVDRDSAGVLAGRVCAIKLATAIPLAAVVLGVTQLLGYGAQTRACVYALIAGMVFDSFGRTIFAVMTAHERNDLLALALVAQRLATAALGLIALAAGYGVVTVAGAYSVGALVGLVVAVVLLLRVAPLRFHHARVREWPALVRESAPFGVQDVFSVALFRLDALILSLMATQSAVGRYGAAYRAFDATVFVSVAISGAFLAMYTYLGPDTQPTVRAVFQRSMKVCLASLLPISVLFAALAGPITRLLFGPHVHAAPALRILSPCVVLLGIVTLSVALFVSRRPPRPMVWVTGAMAILNALLNIALIPSMHDRGAAIAMTATEVGYAALTLAAAVRLLGGVEWISMTAGPILASAALAIPALVFHHSLAPALLVGAPVYLIVLLAVERLVSPGDLEFAMGLIRGRVRTSAVDFAEDFVQRPS